MSMCVANNSPGKAVCQLMKRLQKYINVYTYTYTSLAKSLTRRSPWFARRLTRRYRDLAISPRKSSGKPG